MIQLPEAILAAVRDARSQGRPVFLKEVEAPAHLRGACENCAGMGYVYAFPVESGPYRDPPACGKTADQVITSVDDPMYGWVWYVGRTIGGECPVCKGMKTLPRAPSPVRLGSTAEPVRQLAERFHK